MKRSIFIVLLSGLIACDPGKNTGSDPTTACAEFDQLDAAMLQLIDEINKKFYDEPKFLEAFKMEQVFWIQYRDRRLRSIYPKNWDTHYRKNYGKEVFNPCKCQELLRLAQNRMVDLRMYLDGGPEDQKDCPSMLNK